MPTTPRLSLPYPTADDPPDGAAQIEALAERVEEATYGQSTLATRPPPGVSGRIWIATDSGEVFIDSGTQWISLTTSGSSRLPDVGDLKFSARQTPLWGWIVADGRALAAGEYPSLRAMLVADGNPFGVTGSNPLIPDLSGRGALGVSSTRAFGSKGGVEKVTLTVTEMPSHAHSMSAAAPDTGGENTDHAHNYIRSPRYDRSLQPGSWVTYTSSGDVWTGTTGRTVGHAHGTVAHAHTINGAGGSGPHENMSPYTTANWFIYAGADS